MWLQDVKLIHLFYTFTIVLYSTNGQREHSGEYSDKPCTYEQCIPLASLININLNKIKNQCISNGCVNG